VKIISCIFACWSDSPTDIHPFELLLIHATFRVTPPHTESIQSFLAMADLRLDLLKGATAVRRAHYRHASILKHIVMGAEGCRLQRVNGGLVQSW
jgi:hypothetical protein